MQISNLCMAFLWLEYFLDKFRVTWWPHTQTDAQTTFSSKNKPIFHQIQLLQCFKGQHHPEEYTQFINPEQGQEGLKANLD